MRNKNVYKGIILSEFYFLHTLSCAGLSGRINKSVPFTTKILNELIHEGYITEAGYAPSSGGRRPATFTISPDTLYVLAVAMDQFVTNISILNMENIQVGELKKIELPLANNPDALHILAENMHAVIRDSGLDPRKILGAGIGMPGFIDFKNGINYSFLGNKNKTVTQFLSERLGLPVYIDNDSSLIALAEHRFGAARHQKNTMVINVGWGVGLGMILNGELFRGHNGFAGEFSHMPLFNNNKLCSCGKSGCLETETSLLVVIEKAIRQLKEGRVSGIGKEFPTGHSEQDYEIIIDAALKGDQFAVSLLSEVGYNIGRGVAILIHLMNPESVVLSGRGALAGKLLQTPIQQAMNEHCIPRLALNTTVDISTLGYRAEMIGSAALVMESRVKEQLRSTANGKKPRELLPV